MGAAMPMLIPTMLGLDAVFKFTCGSTAVGIDTGCIGKPASIDQIDNLIQIFGANHADHRAEYFFLGDGHIGFDIVKNGRADKKAIWKFGRL